MSRGFEGVGKVGTLLHKIREMSKTRFFYLLMFEYWWSKGAARKESIILKSSLIISVITPVVMNKLESKGLFLRYPWASTPLSVIICGICLTFATPMCCALFEQRASIKVDALEEELKNKIDRRQEVVYYNKGL